MKNSKFRFFAVFCAVIALFSGCFKTKPTEVKHTFAGSVWNRFDVREATFEISNVNKTYEVAVSLGIIDGFALDNVPLEIVITSPDGQQNIINTTMAVRKDGNYLGKVYGDIWTTELTIYREKQFLQAGEYTVAIQNRTQYYDLENVESLAFSVRPMKKMKNE